MDRKTTVGRRSLIVTSARARGQCDNSCSANWSWQITLKVSTPFCVMPSMLPSLVSTIGVMEPRAPKAAAVASNAATHRRKATANLAVLARPAPRMRRRCSPRNRAERLIHLSPRLPRRCACGADGSFSAAIRTSNTYSSISTSKSEISRTLVGVLKFRACESHRISAMVWCAALRDALSIATARHFAAALHEALTDGVHDADLRAQTRARLLAAGVPAVALSALFPDLHPVL